MDFSPYGIYAVQNFRHMELSSHGILAVVLFSILLAFVLNACEFFPNSNLKIAVAVSRRGQCSLIFLSAQFETIYEQKDVCCVHSSSS